MTPASRPGLARALAIALLAAGCGAPEGTIEFSIATAPESAIMEDIERVRLTLSDPPAETEAERRADGSFDLALDVVAEGERGRITFEGFDTSGDRIAVGHAGPLPMASINVQASLYVAAPDRFAEAPVRMDPARKDLGAAPLVFGAALVGGSDESGAPLDDALIYNVHSHAFQVGEPLPSPRAAPAVAARQPGGPVYIFGGRNPDGESTETAWSFDTQAPPAGVYTELDIGPELAREGAAAAPLGDAAFVVTGDPLIEIDAGTGIAQALSGAPPLRGTATATEAGGEAMVLATDNDEAEARAARVREDDVEALGAPEALARRGHAAAALPGGDVLILGGEREGAALASAVRYEPGENAFEVLDDLLATPRREAAVAASRSRLVVAGGRDREGAVLADAEIFDAETLTPLGSVPLVVPRSGAAAVPLENGQILLAGGAGEDGAPIAVIELFTPDL